MKWQLRKISTKEVLKEAAKLPNNWGPIFGMENVQDRIGDLSWLGDDFKDMGWFPVDDEGEDDGVISAEIIKNMIDKKIEESNAAVALDSGLNVEEMSLWLEYRRQLKNIPYQANYPNNVVWPKKP